jgi:hypothetical protein
MHAHRCKHCAGQGLSTVWIHGDEMANNVEAHTCPKCGHTEWEKWLVPAGQLPKMQHAAQLGQPLYVIPLDHIIVALMYLVYAAIMVYASMKLWDKWQTKKLPKV